MKSLICPLGGGRGVSAALEEAETFAYHCTLREKDALHLRLLAEELLGMVGGVLEVREGSFWIEREGMAFQLHLTAAAPVGQQARDILVAASTDEQNAAYAGVTGRIRRALDFLTGAEGGVAVGGIQGGLLPSAQDLQWSLEQYRQEARREEKAQAWDELERSVLGKLADDIRVGVRPDRVEITIFANFT